MNVDLEVAVSHVRDESGGVVGQVLCSILAILGAVATFAVVRIAIDRIRSGGDPGVLTVAIVPGLFTLAFLALAVLSGAQLRQDKTLAERQALHPDEPWLWADDWREGRITSVSSRKTAALVAVFAGFWNTFVIAGALVAWRSGTSMETGYWLFLVTFGLVGLALIAGAVYLAVQARKSPPTVFEMSTFPGVLGGDLRGTISLPPHLPAGSDARLRVSCVRTPRTTSRSSSDTTLWQDEVTLRTSPTGVLPVAFRIPFESAAEPIARAERRAVDRPDSVAPLRRRERARRGLQPDVRRAGVRHAGERSLCRRRAGRQGREFHRPEQAKATVVESSTERTVIDLPTPQGRGCGLAALVLLPILAWPIARYNGADAATTMAATGVAFLAGVGLMLVAGLMLAWTAARIEIDAAAIRVLHGRWPFLRTRTIPIPNVTSISFGSGDARYVEVAIEGGTTYWIVPGNSSGTEETKWLAGEVNRAVERVRKAPTPSVR